MNVLIFFESKEIQSSRYATFVVLIRLTYVTKINLNGVTQSWKLEKKLETRCIHQIVKRDVS